MIRLHGSMNVLFILTISLLWISIYSLNTTNLHARYPYVLPKCCEQNVNTYQARSSRSYAGGPNGACSVDGTEVILISKLFFPAMSSELEHVEVELRNLVDGLQCDEGSDEDILIDFEDLKDLTTVKLGTKTGFDEFGFSVDNFLSEGNIYSPRHFCISSRSANKSHLDIKTCKRKCIPGNPCVPRCCGGHQSILTSHPTSPDSFTSSCSTPSLQKDLWSPHGSKIVKTNDKVLYYQERHTFPQGNCRMLYFNENMLDVETPLNLLDNGRLHLNFENTTFLPGDFCIDGLKVGEGRISNSHDGDEYEIQEKREVVVAYVCSSEEGSVSKFQSFDEYNDNDVFSLPACTGPSHFFDQLFLMPRNFFKRKQNDTRNKVPVRLKNSGRLECPELYEDFTVHFKHVTSKVFLEDGSLIYDGYYLDQTQFCVRSIFDNAITLRACKEECSENRPCINRCCSGNTHLDIAAVSALPFGKPWKMKCEMPSSLIKTNGAELSQRSHNYTESVHPTFDEEFDVQPLIRKRRPSARLCLLSTPNRYERLLEVVPYRLTKRGDLMEKKGRKTWIKVNLEEYCIEPFMRRDKNRDLELSGNANDILVWRCWSNPVVSGKKYVGTKPKLLSALYFTFSVFYVAIAVVYIMRKDKEPVFRWSIVFCSISMFLTYCFFGYTRISYLYHETQTHYFTTCAFIGMLANFVYLMGFSWITVLCFDIWLTFALLRPGKKSLKRLFWYGSITLTIPTAIVGTGVTLDLIYFGDLFTDVIVPKYGVKRCLFEPTDAALPYLYGPLAVLTGINFFLFFATVVKLWIARHSSDISRSKHDAQKSRKNTFLVYFKLFLLMGLIWVLEILGWVFTELDKPLTIWAIVAEIFTLLQPAFVFFFLVWNDETKRYIGTNYPKVKGAIDLIDRIEDQLQKVGRFFMHCTRAQKGDLGRGTSSNATRDTTLS